MCLALTIMSSVHSKLEHKAFSDMGQQEAIYHVFKGSVCLKSCWEDKNDWYYLDALDLDTPKLHQQGFQASLKIHEAEFWNSLWFWANWDKYVFNLSSKMLSNFTIFLSFKISFSDAFRSIFAVFFKHKKICHHRPLFVTTLHMTSVLWIKAEHQRSTFWVLNRTKKKKCSSLWFLICFWCLYVIFHDLYVVSSNVQYVILETY